MRKRSGFFAYWSSQIKVFMMLLILVASGILLAAADFGESSDSLGQITDEFDTLDNVSVRVEIVRNSTYNAMELNLSQRGPAYENFTDYTRIGADTVLTINDYEVSYTQYHRGDEDSIYLGLGTSIGDFEFEFEVIVSDVEAGDSSSRNIINVFTVANWIGDLQNQPPGTYDYAYVAVRNIGTQDNRYSFSVVVAQNGAQLGSLTSALYVVSNDVLYFRVNRTSGNFYVWWYSDSARTVLIEALSYAGGGLTDTYPYLYGIMAVDAAGDAGDWCSGSVSNLWNTDNVTLGYASEGYFITTDYLGGVNGSVLTQLTNATIPAGTGITAEFSSDNSSWVNPTSLTAGFMAIDLRDLNWSTAHYVRYNMSGTVSETPRLYQSRLITTEGPIVIVPGAPGQNVSSEWVEYNLTEIGVTVGTLDSGDLNSTLDIDGDLYNVSELVGAPGMQISGNFSGVDPDASCLWVVLYAHYDGNLNHDFDIEVWNFTSSAWVEDSHITDGTELTWFNSTIYALRIPSEFLSGGEVRVRLDHEAPGNINHDLFIEYFKLLAEIPAGPTPGAGTVVNIIESDTPWIAIAIILMCVAYLLFRPK